MFKKKLGQRGFTLIELLVVIAIIGILSSVVLVSLQSSRAKARDAKRIADLGALQTALALFYDSNNSYPAALSDLVPSLISATPAGPNGEAYLYVRSSDNLSYHLGSTLEQVNEAQSGSVLATDRDCRSGSSGTTALCAGFSAAVAGGFDGGVQTEHVYDVTP